MVFYRCVCVNHINRTGPNPNNNPPRIESVCDVGSLTTVVVTDEFLVISDSLKESQRTIEDPCRNGAVSFFRLHTTCGQRLVVLEVASKYVEGWTTWGELLR